MKNGGDPFRGMLSGRVWERIQDKQIFHQDGILPVKLDGHWVNWKLLVGEEPSVSGIRLVLTSRYYLDRYFDLVKNKESSLFFQSSVKSEVRLIERMMCPLYQHHRNKKNYLVVSECEFWDEWFWSKGVVYFDQDSRLLYARKINDFRKKFSHISGRKV